MSDEDENDLPEYASPPCFVHELSLDAPPASIRSDVWDDVSRWRNAERRRLIGERMALASADRIARSARLAEKLDLAVGRVSGHIISSYWPFRGEPDLRNWAINVIERGGRVALPVVLQKARPLEFRVWNPGDPLERGIWNILVPSRGPAVLPDIVIAPVVGFDTANYRLGHGGGYFDRTLASMHRMPVKIGIGFATSKIATIYPQPHDIPMDVIVTD